MNPINDFKKKVETKSKGGVVKKALKTLIPFVHQVDIIMNYSSSF